MSDHPIAEDPRAIEQFSSAVAHELNNLLQVVNGNLEILSARMEDEQLLSYLANAQTAACLMTELARELYEQPMDRFVDTGPRATDGERRSAAAR